MATLILQGQTRNPTLECCWDAARPWQQLLFLSAGPHGGSSLRNIQGFHGYPRWISQGFQRSDPSCLPLNPSFMAKRGALSVHPLSSGCSSSAGPALPASSTLLCGVLIKAFKVEKRLISTSLPLGVGALIAHEQKIKRNYSSGDTRQRDPGK